MPQLVLFPSSGRVLADDVRGHIAYTPHLVAAPVAERWFAQLRTEVGWKAEQRRMYDRDVQVPRLVAHFDLADDAGAAVVPDAIGHAARLLAAQTKIAFNSVGLNLYRDGRDSVAPHNDHLNVLAKGFPIALVSLGATRRMTIRAKEAPRRVLHVDLESGSLLTMSYETQLHYTHGIAKTAQPVGERISLAFRVRPARESPASSAPAGYR